MPQLPNDVAAYLDAALRKVDWQHLNSATPGICTACPQSGRMVTDDDDQVCLSCPWWGVLYSHMQAQHWHGYRHSKRKAASRGDDPGHD